MPRIEWDSLQCVRKTAGQVRNGQMRPDDFEFGEDRLVVTHLCEVDKTADPERAQPLQGFAIEGVATGEQSLGNDPGEFLNFVHGEPRTQCTYAFLPQRDLRRPYVQLSRRRTYAKLCITPEYSHTTSFNRYEL